MRRLSWLGHQSCVVFALAAVWREGGAGWPITGHWAAVAPVGVVFAVACCAVAGPVASNARDATQAKDVGEVFMRFRRADG